jgi:hypothetical protein
MQQHDAYALLASELAAYRELSYDELAELVGASSSRRVRAADSTHYVVEVNVRWLPGKSGQILVEGLAATADCGPLRRLDHSFVVLAPSAS